MHLFTHYVSHIGGVNVRNAYNVARPALYIYASDGTRSSPPPTTYVDISHFSLHSNTKGPSANAKDDQHTPMPTETSNTDTNTYPQTKTNKCVGNVTLLQVSAGRWYD